MESPSAMLSHTRTAGRVQRHLTIVNDALTFLGIAKTIIQSEQTLNLEVSSSIESKGVINNADGVLYGKRRILLHGRIRNCSQAFRAVQNPICQSVVSDVAMFRWAKILTHANSSSIDLELFRSIQRNEHLSLVEENARVDDGFPVPIDCQKTQRDGPIVKTLLFLRMPMIYGSRPYQIVSLCSGGAGPVSRKRSWRTTMPPSVSLT